MFSPEILLYGRLRRTFVNVGFSLLFSPESKGVSEANSNILSRPEQHSRLFNGFVLVGLFTQMQLCVSKRDRRDVNISELKALLKTTEDIVTNRSKVQLNPASRKEASLQGPEPPL